MKQFIWQLPLLFCIFSCNKNQETPSPPDEVFIPASSSVEKIEATAQRSGNIQFGFKYLTEGDYITQGVDYQVFQKLELATANELQRTGDAAQVPYNYNLITNNGKQLITPNCLTCHAQYLNNQLVIGLGNSFFDATTNSVDGIKTTTVGINIANKLGEYYAFNRDVTTLKITNTKNFDVQSGVIPIDVPAWWLLAKKNAMYYATWGRGDFARTNLGATLISVKDTNEARVIDSHFSDVLAYIKSLKPPKYMQSIDANLVASGLKIFTNKCSGCHGTYETNNATYPNYLVSVDYVGTDATILKDKHHTEDFANFWNSSWFATAKPTAQFKKTNGYIAPPLDGVWATAPYLHNGSVPTLEDLLNSTQRPKIWRRSGKNDDFDFKKNGWNYTIETSKIDKFTYDTSIEGYGNQGHLFGDGLSSSDRKALIEYLKTL